MTAMRTYAHPASFRPTPLLRQGGLSLIELMISLTIGLLLLAGISSLIVNQSKSRADLEKVTRQIENGRYAIYQIQNDAQLAGFYGEFSNQGSTAITTPATLPDPCVPVSAGSTVADLLAALPLHVQGYQAVAAPLTNCLLAANHLAGTDILVVRRAGTEVITSVLPAAAPTGQIYLQSTLAGAVMGTDSSAAATWTTLKKKDGVTNGDIRKWLVHIYFVSPCRTPAGAACAATDDNNNPIPTLKRLELNSAGGFTVTPLAEGIENLQIEYGVDTDNDGAPDSFVTAPATTADWYNVMALKVHVLARNTEITVGHRDDKTYVLGGTTIAPTNDQYQRHVFSTLVRLINPGGRREQ
jgi:type IV pilus assembly protein PilW